MRLAFSTQNPLTGLLINTCGVKRISGTNCGGWLFSLLGGICLLRGELGSLFQALLKTTGYRLNADEKKSNFQYPQSCKENI